MQKEVSARYKDVALRTLHLAVTDVTFSDILPIFTSVEDYSLKKINCVCLNTIPIQYLIGNNTNGMIIFNIITAFIEFLFIVALIEENHQE